MEGIYQMINIIYEDNHLLVVEKPINMPVQSDISGDLDLLTLIKKFIKERDNKPGNLYLGLVHRLDRPVGGIMVFAKTSKCASRLSDQIRKRELKKTYLAVIEGKISNNGLFVDKLIKDSKSNMVKVDDRGKEAVLDYKVLDYKDNKSFVRINLKTGRSHQIRVQFSHHGYPLYGDQKYNPKAKKGEQIALFAEALSFIHPIKKEPVNFSIKIKNKYPWNIFNF